MTVQPTRDQLRALADHVLDNGHYLVAEEEVEIAQGVRSLLDQLDQAEARIKAVEDVIDRPIRHVGWDDPLVSATHVRRALEG